MSILDKIVETKKYELSRFNDRYLESIEIMAEERKEKPLSLLDFLKNDEISIIAEIKKASPSKGIIREDFNHIEIGKIYRKCGASAISVLTDEEYFKGSLQYLSDVKKEVKDIPLLRKDFIIDEKQIFESYSYGADSFLLIVRILDEIQLKDFIEYGRELGMEPLIEIHNLDEGITALKMGGKIIGINNRDLQTFHVDIELTKRLSPILKENGAEVVISESGISSYSDIQELREYHVDGFLIGESLMRERDVCKKLRTLKGM